jgi:hypothetical protein
MNEELNKIREQIKNGNTDLAIESLEKIDFISKKNSNAIKTVSDLYSDLKRIEDLNLFSYQEISIQKESINNSLLEIISSIEKMRNQNVPKESEQKPKRLIQKRHIDILISHQRSSIRYFFCYSIGLVLIGVIVIVIGVKFSNETMKTAMNIGGGLISSVSLFPIKELLQRMGKIETLEILSVQLDSLNQIDVIEEDKLRLNDLVWKIFEKTALSV